ncbi:hypothetical protein CEP54_003953 [Fusarium duplospermum]|uniref:Uncharacterized protein n=1 Tax=Fusarium duplospermum TaxID=1325734 RepID=A0A428QLC5_9HYPO|nr:hypothetical protein CEP54_003953 [Fusarium duplospermum]
MVTKAQSDPNLVLPRFEKNSNPRQTAQYRIARAMGRCFGFMPDAKNDNARTDQWWSRLFETFDAMVLGLQGPGVTLQFDDVWTWVGADDLGPEAPDLDSSDYDKETKLKLKEDFKMKNRHPDKFSQGYSGGWYYRQRMDWRKKVNQNPPAQACVDGATGTILFELDVIHICSVNFQSKSINAGSPVGAQITRDETKIGSFNASVSNTFVHEFTHWFLTRQVIDQQSLNKDGKWVYQDRDDENVYRTRKHSEKTRKKNELIEDVTYGYKDVSNLAKTWVNGSGGPQYATETAEAYAFFAMMSRRSKEGVLRSAVSVIPASTIIKNTFPIHHSIISQC